MKVIAVDPGVIIIIEGAEMSKTKIEWTEHTWNPLTGCTKISDGCKHCYAETMSKRLKAAGNPRYANGFELTLWHDKIDEPMSVKVPRTYFVNSMSDLFHKDVPDDFIESVFDTMAKCPQHTFQVLTKRSERLAEWDYGWRNNVWMGVSVENEKVRGRIDHLRLCKAKTRWLSVEPLLGPLPNLELSGIDWVVVGGESGPGARPMHPDWVRDIRDQCVNRKFPVPFFFKQWGGTNKKKTGRELDGRTWDEYPERLPPG